MKRNFNSYRHQYTLVEMMCVIFFLLIISGVAMRSFYRFRYSYRSTTKNSLRMRQIAVLGKQWRKSFDGELEGIPAVKDGKIVWKDNYVVLIKGKIIIHRAGKTYSLRLPEKTNAGLTVENTSLGKWLLVLNFNWKYSRSNKTDKTEEEHMARIVASTSVQKKGRLYE